MLLAADVGNTHVTLGAFAGPEGALLREWRLATDPRKTADQYGPEVLGLVRHAFPGRAVEGFVYGSVVPALDPAFAAVARRYLGVDPVAVTPASPVGIRLKVDRPAEVGADRLLNALAAWRLHGGPAVVMDFGTATTFDCVSGRGDYLGGAIMIGPRLAAWALAERTAKLPEVPIARPRRFIGRNTVECLQAGLYHGYLGMVLRVLRGTLEEMPRGRGAAPRGKVRLLATGGLAGLFKPELPKAVRWVPDLTLQGLRLAYVALSASHRAGRRTGLTTA